MQHVQAESAEHMYHVLETPHHSKPQHLNGMIPDSGWIADKPNSSTTAGQLVPIYQDVAELCPSAERANEAKKMDPTLSPSKQGKLMVVPVYQEITELSRERADTQEQYTMHGYIYSSDVR